MRRLSSVLLSASLLLQPASAFALYETPGQILQAVRFDASAKSFKAELHGHSGTMYVSAWMNGAMQGTSATDAQISAQMTIDMEDTGSHIKGRFKGSVMVLEGRLFAKLDSMEGTFEDDVMMGSVRFLTKKWIAFPADDDMVDAIQEMINQTGDPSEADDLYTMTRVPYDYGNSYTLTVRDGADVPFPGMQVKIDTDYKDTVQVSQISIDGMVDTFSVSGNIKAERMKTPLALSAPADAVSLDALIGHIGDIDAADVFPGIGMPFDTDEDDWSEIIDEEEDIAPAPKPRTSRVRAPQKSSEPVDRVNSGVERPSRRQIKQGNTNRS